MKLILGTLCWFIGTLAYAWVNQRIGYHRGEKRGKMEGFDAGYALGHKEADSWWISSESGIDQARQKLWERRTK